MANVDNMTIRVENGPIVLEPSKEYFSYLREYIADKGGRSRNVIRHLHEFFTVEKCPLFDETEYLGAEVSSPHQ